MNPITPKVSIIIPFYNCQYIDRAIESALNQSYNNCEIIVIDDGSTQHVERINPYKGKITYIKKGNGGTASALNLGILHAKGEYFSWLSSDDMYHPEKIRKQLQFMQDQQAVISYGNYYLMNARDHITSEPVGVGFADKWFFLKTMRSGCIINGCTVMAKINAIKEIGMFDESLPFTHDYDLWLRLIPKYDFPYFPEPLVYYRIHGAMGSKVHKEVIRNEIHKVKRKHRDQMSRLINMITRAKRNQRYL
ncbi:glycosyltransferase [Pseudalkalibacillus salsuginis]|uniref:glycosyltransferase n=1 Tax=Pseudalkalibacillus salsuginis TaxID=2910972 RepID=UPI001F20F1A1|nr:glycosyltransferase [Pseudalkalibacillus salsuginis]MCF6409160.1 glycosyltransferase [Pseudalkalibacillus salsuginis]